MHVHGLRDYHMVLRGRLVSCSCGPKNVSFNRRWKVDKAAMHDPANCAKLQQVLDQVRKVPWFIHPELHFDIVNDEIRALCEQAFPPKGGRRRRREHISGAQWDLAEQRFRWRKIKRNGAALCRDGLDADFCHAF
eukprot:7608301-Karenia_brevis.AAC.1